MDGLELYMAFQGTPQLLLYKLREQVQSNPYHQCLKPDWFPTTNRCSLPPFPNDQSLFPVTVSQRPISDHHCFPTTSHWSHLFVPPLHFIILNTFLGDILKASTHFLHDYSMSLLLLVCVLESVVFCKKRKSLVSGAMTKYDFISFYKKKKR